MLTKSSADRSFPQSLVRPLASGGQASTSAIFNCAGRRTERSARQTGFSLVELMIAITIGLIILLAVGIVFNNVSKGFRATDNSSRVMENGNFALRVLGQDLRMVGFVGMAPDPGAVGPAQVYAVGNNCIADAGWPFLPQPSIEYLPAASAATLSACILAIAPNSPVIVVRHATGAETPGADLASDANKNLFFVQGGPSTGLIFQGKDYANLVKGADRQYSVCANNACTAAQDAPIFGYGVSVYYIRPCSRESGAICHDAGDSGPTLVRLQLSNEANPGFVETPIAEGVERLAVVYFDAAGNQLTPLPAANLAAAVTARISILLRTRQEMGDTETDSANTYTLADGTPFNCVADGIGADPCKYRRYLYNDTVVLKNFDYRSITYGIVP